LLKKGEEVSESARAYVALGTNIGDRTDNIKRALRLLHADPQIRLLRLSPLYETTPRGFVEQDDFLNAVVEMDTDYGPHALLSVLLATETGLGRVRLRRWGPRVIDLDILLCDGAQIHEPGLTIPHPHMYERGFVLAPLADLIPDLPTPEGRTVADLATDLSVEQGVHPYIRLSLQAALCR